MDTSLKTVLDADQLVADFGDYYLDAGQNLSNLHMLPFESFDTRDAFTIIPTEDTILRESNVEYASVLQQYQDEFTPKGGVAFEPVQIPLFQQKIDQLLVPTKLQRSWLGFLTSNDIDRAQWPIIRWFIEVYLGGQANEDLEMDAIYKGKWEAPIEGEPGEASKAMDGVETLIKQFIADGRVDVRAIGAIDGSAKNYVTQVENFVKSLPEKYQKMKMELNVSRTLETHFKEGMQEKYNLNYAQVSQLVQVRNFENITVKGRPSMMGKTRHWMTPKYNALMGVKGYGNKNAFRVESEKRKVAVFTDWWAGIGFIQPKILFTSDEQNP